MSVNNTITRSVVILCVGLIILGVFLMVTDILDPGLRPIVIYTNDYSPSITVQKIHALTNAIHVRSTSDVDTMKQSIPYCFDRRLTMYSRQHILSMEARTLDRPSILSYYGVDKGIMYEFIIDGNVTTIYPELNSSRYIDILRDQSFISLGIASNNDETRWHFTLWDSKCRQTILYSEEVRHWLDDLTK